MPSNKIYLVIGTTGEYSDRKEWYVCAYHSKELAEEHASKAMHRAKELEKIDGGWDAYDSRLPRNEFDSGMYMDYTGTMYLTAEIELRDEVPNAI